MRFYELRFRLIATSDNFWLEIHSTQNGVLNSTDKKASQPYLSYREADFQEASLSFALRDKFTKILQIVLSLTILCTVGTAKWDHR